MGFPARDAGFVHPTSPPAGTCSTGWLDLACAAAASQKQPAAATDVRTVDELPATAPAHGRHALGVPLPTLDGCPRAVLLLGCSRQLGADDLALALHLAAAIAERHAPQLASFASAVCMLVAPAPPSAAADDGEWELGSGAYSDEDEHHSASSADDDDVDHTDDDDADASGSSGGSLALWRPCRSLWAGMHPLLLCFRSAQREAQFRR